MFARLFVRQERGRESEQGRVQETGQCSSDAENKNVRPRVEDTTAGPEGQPELGASLHLGSDLVIAQWSCLSEMPVWGRTFVMYVQQSYDW